MKIIKQRCLWVNLNSSIYVGYHDREWGILTHNDNVHLKLLTLHISQTDSGSEPIHMHDSYKSWHVYMVRCNDNSLYTGITNNVARRVAEHNSQTNKSAKYLRGKTPCTLVYSEYAGNRSSASKREIAIKKMSKYDKELLTLLISRLNQFNLINLVKL